MPALPPPPLEPPVWTPPSPDPLPPPPPHTLKVGVHPAGTVMVVVCAVVKVPEWVPQPAACVATASQLLPLQTSSTLLVAL